MFWMKSKMETITFAGIEGEVIESSPHNNYLVVRLSARITIVGTFSNQFCWQEMPDASSGFEIFITYIGVRSTASASNTVKQIVAGVGGYFYSKEQQPRKSKRVKGFPFELKVRGLTADFVAEIVRQPTKFNC